jgi:hypothetical protein
MRMHLTDGSSTFRVARFSQDQDTCIITSAAEHRYGIEQVIEDLEVADL